VFFRLGLFDIRITVDQNLVQFETARSPVISFTTYCYRIKWYVCYRYPYAVAFKRRENVTSSTTKPKSY